MTTVQQYCLRWNNHQPNFISVFSSLLLNETLVDVTLAAEGRQLQAHKVVLSACSSYFQSLFTTNPCKHPIVILKDVQYNDLKTMVDFMYYGEVNVSTEQLPQILKTAEMLKIKGLAEMPDAASVTKSDSKSSDHTDGNQSISGVESMWGSTESQQQAQQQQYHTIRRTPSPSNMSPATRRKRLRKTSTGSGSINISASIERIQDEHQQQIQHQQQTTMDGRMMQKYSQQQSVDVPLSTFSAVSQTGAIANVRGLKINSSPENQMQHQHQQDQHEHIDESQHITEMKTEDLSCVNQSMPLDISTGTSTTPVSCPPTQQHSGGQWAVIDTNYSRFALTTSAAALPTSTVQHSAAHHHHHHHHHEGNIATAQTGAQSVGHGNDNMSLGSNHSSSHGSNNSNSNNNATIQSQNSTPVQLQYQTTYSPQIIAVNPNNIVNNYPPSISTPNSPLVQSVYSQQSTPIQSPVNIQNSTNDASTSASNNNSVNANSSSGSLNAAAPPKRKRSVNPQGEENFLRALDAVRFGGIGFCKETQQSELLFTSCSSISSPSSPISLSLSSPAIITATTNVVVGANNNNNNNINTSSSLSAASKRGRLLIRQQRVKKDGDQTGDLETPEAGIYQEYLLSVPSSGARMERHASEPSPATSSGLITTSSSSSVSGNLLSVPTHTSYLIKQHSHPLLPSQSSSPSTSYTLTRQLSHPIQTISHQTSQIVSTVTSHGGHDIGTHGGQLLQMHHQHKSAPVRSQTLPHYTVTDMDFSSGGSEKAQTSSNMSNSPTVVIIPDVSSDHTTTVVQSHIPSQHNIYQKSSSHHHLQLPSIRVKSEELQRSVSSPLASTRSELSFETTTRSSHCPTLRAGPALGCNFCWNTIDAHGRILRRKTKYHCPECQTNLCIVPCFQEYHERQSSEGSNETSSTKSSGLKSLKSSQTI